MINQKSLVKIKELEVFALSGGRLDRKDLDFLFLCILQDEYEDVYIASLLLLTESELDVVQELMSRYSELPQKVRLMLLSFLASLDFVECYLFLFEMIKTYEFIEELNVTVYSLSQTHYLILAAN